MFKKNLILSVFILILCLSLCAGCSVDNKPTPGNKDIENGTEIALKGINMIETFSCANDTIIVSGNTSDNISKQSFESQIEVLDKDGNVLNNIKPELTKNQSILAVAMNNEQIWCVIDAYGDFDGEDIAEPEYFLISLNNDGKISIKEKLDFSIGKEDIVDINSLEIDNDGKIYVLQGTSDLIVYDSATSESSKSEVDLGDIDIAENGNVYAIDNSGIIYSMSDDKFEKICETPLELVEDDYDIKISGESYFIKNAYDLYQAADFKSEPELLLSFEDMNITDDLVNMDVLNNNEILLHTYNEDYTSKFLIINVK